jgi:hypothetical protein
LIEQNRLMLPKVNETPFCSGQGLQVTRDSINHNINGRNHGSFIFKASNPLLPSADIVAENEAHDVVSRFSEAELFTS